MPDKEATKDKKSRLNNGLSQDFATRKQGCIKMTRSQP